LRGWLSVLLIVVYVVAGNLLALRAFRYRADPNARWGGYQIWYSRFFTPEGQVPRVLAVRFFIIGGIGLALVLWLLGR
jgi:hypothetical protein